MLFSHGRNQREEGSRSKGIVCQKGGDFRGIFGKIEAEIWEGQLLMILITYK